MNQSTSPKSPQSALLELNDPSIDWDDFSSLKYMTCVNHPTARYLTKNPWQRGLHFVTQAVEAVSMTELERVEAGWKGPFYLECPCPFSDLRVVPQVAPQV